MIYKNKAFRITMNVIMVLLTLCCILPFILLIASSFSSEADPYQVWIFFHSKRFYACSL